MPVERLFPLIAEFDRLGSGTQLRLTLETVGYGWDALLERRADLAVGLTGDPPTPFGYDSRALGTAEFVFAMSPKHPLAAAEEPVPAHELARHRIVMAASTDRRLPPRRGVLPDQSVLVVPSMAAKIAAQVEGLGVGFVPLHLATPLLAAGLLVTKEVNLVRSLGACRAAWRSGNEGRALSWFVERLQQPDFADALFEAEPVRMAS